MQQICAGLAVRHHRGSDFDERVGRFLDADQMAALEAAHPAVEHPLLRTHPRTGETARQGTRYALKPKLGAALRAFATLLGKSPDDQECVILTEDVPAFVRCDGPLYVKGPIWRIEMISPR